MPVTVDPAWGNIIWKKQCFVLKCWKLISLFKVTNWKHSSLIWTHLDFWQAIISQGEGLEEKSV